MILQILARSACPRICASFPGGDRRGPGLRLVLSALFVILMLGPADLPALAATVSGTVTDPAGMAVTKAAVELIDAGGDVRVRTFTDASGHFQLAEAAAGRYQLVVRAAGFQSVQKGLRISAADEPQRMDFRLGIHATESVTATSDVSELDLFSPDPAEKVFVRQDLVDANPGRPGAPVSIPGYPIETASGGIKAPQYFAPGVAGDHGEPIAQFIAVGGSLVPNNLSANAHGNGYADPNILISAVLADVEVDGGSFNVREGNHAVNEAATYGARSQVDPFLTVAGDYRDIDAAAGLRLGPAGWVAIEGAFGNGFLKRLEHRHQYKINVERAFETGRHRTTVAGIGYYGASMIPGLVPVAPLNSLDTAFADGGDTIDPRQREQTHTGLLALNDEWTRSGSQQMQFSGFFRTYNLSLCSDFGQGLIRQSEFRTVAGGSGLYSKSISDRLSLLTGLEVVREAPRRDDLDRYGFYAAGSADYGAFSKVTANNVTITPVTPYMAIQGAFGSRVRYYAGWRYDEIEFDNQDLLDAPNSFHEWTGVNSPKATVSIIPGPEKWTPLVSASGGESFFTLDPRIGNGMGADRGVPVSRAHAYQLVISKRVAQADVRLTVGHVTTAEQLAKIDPDTGLEENQGPGRLRFLTAAVRQPFVAGSVLVTYSKADARQVDTGQPTAEAPRTIFDVLGVTDKLPLHLQAKGEFEYVGAKPLGTGCEADLRVECRGIAVRQFRGAAARPFADGRFSIGVNLLWARGFTGQTLETFYPMTTSTISGVRIPSYASASVTYRFGRATIP